MAALQRFPLIPRGLKLANDPFAEPPHRVSNSHPGTDPADKLHTVHPYAGHKTFTNSSSHNLKAFFFSSSSDLYTIHACTAQSPATFATHFKIDRSSSIWQGLVVYSYKSFLSLSLYLERVLFAMHF